MISAANDSILERLVSSRSKLVDSFFWLFTSDLRRSWVLALLVLCIAVKRCAIARLMRPAALCKQSNDIRKIKL